MPETIPMACSLDQDARPDRAETMARLGGKLLAVEAEGLSAHLRFDGGREPVDEFVRDESACCPFFDFRVADEGATTMLAVAAPEGGEWAVRGLVAGFVAGWGGWLV